MPSIMAAVFNVLVCMGLPLGVLVVLLLKRRSLAFSFALGVGTFLASQVFTRIPLLQLLRGQPWFVAFTIPRPIQYAVLLALSAGVFEEGGRYLAMRPARSHHSYADALTFGVGHGGIEAFLAGIGSLNALLSQRDMLAATPPLSVALVGIERIFAMVLHIGLSVLVMHAAAHKRPLWLGLAVLLHTLVDAAVGLFPLWGLGVVAIEGWLVLCAIITTVLALTLRRAFSPAAQTQKESLHEEVS